MKKFLRKTGSFLIDLLLFGTMMKSAQMSLNLDFGWGAVGCVVLFSLALNIYMDKNNKTNK